MANDYIFIKCKHCGHWTTLMKFYPGEAYVPSDNWALGFTKWLDWHGANCLPNPFGGDLGGDALFELMAESDDRLNDWLDPNKRGLPEGASDDI